MAVLWHSQKIPLYDTSELHTQDRHWSFQERARKHFWRSVTNLCLATQTDILRTAILLINTGYEIDRQLFTCLINLRTIHLSVWLDKYVIQLDNYIHLLTDNYEPN